MKLPHAAEAAVRDTLPHAHADSDPGCARWCPTSVRFRWLSPDPAWPAGTRAIGEVAVCAQGLHRLISGGRGVLSASFARGSDDPVRSVDATTLAARLAPLVADLESAVTELASAIDNAAPSMLAFDVTEARTPLRPENG